MTELRPPLDNGYVCIFASVECWTEALRLADRLRDFRAVLRATDCRAMGDPHHDTILELWVHPDERLAVAAILGDYLRCRERP